MLKKSKGIIIFVVLAIFFIVGTFYTFQLFFTPNLNIKSKEAAEVLIPPGASINTVLDSLTANEQLNDVLSFMFVSKLLSYHENVKQGRYLLKPEITNLEGIRYLRSGDQAPVKATFGSVRSVEEMAVRLCRNLHISDQELIELLQDDGSIQKLGFDRANLPGLFIPNTYEMYWDATAETVLNRMKKEYDKFWNDDRLAQAKAVGLSPQEVSTLAAIVEAETKKAEERPIVAGLYLNRLRKGIPLSSDPTLVFAMGDFTITRVLDSHKEVRSPYNTYKNKGLPPGPINIPPIQALEAVLSPASHSYIYMCAKEDFSGYHNFTASYAEHQQNAKRYWQALNARKIFK